MIASPALGLFLLPATLLVGDEDPPEWGGFRGNNGCGVAESEGIPEVLDVDQSALWKAEIPGGYSSPAIVGERVFVTASEGTKLLTMCLDRYSGEVLWSRDLEFSGQRTGMNSPAAASPATDGERVYAVFHDFGLIAYTVDGDDAWEFPLGRFEIPHGMSTSPVIHEDVLVLQVDQDVDPYLLAVNKKTGKELWRVERPGVTHSYSTPAIYAPEEGPAQVVVSGSFQIAGYDVKTGERIWWMNGSSWQTKAVPLIVGDVCYVNAYMVPSNEIGLPKIDQTFVEALVERDLNGDEKIGRDEYDHEMLQMAWFIFDLDGDEMLDERDWNYLRSTSTAMGGLFAIKLDGKGDITDTHVAWKFGDRRGLPDMSSPLIYDGLLYMIKEGGLMTAVDIESGEVVKQGRVGDGDNYAASPVAAAGRIVTASGTGQLAVIEGGPEWEVLSVTNLDEEIWSTPAIAGEQVFVRTLSALYCFQSLAD